VILGHFWPRITPSTSFFLFSFNLNKWFSHLSSFSFRFFVISSSKCGVVLFVILCGIWFRVLLRCSFISYWKIYISQLQIQPIIWTSTLQIRKHGYFGDLCFIILFVGILQMYAINFGVMSLFANSPFTFLAMFISDVLYRFKWMNIVLFLSKKIKIIITLTSIYLIFLTYVFLLCILFLATFL